MTVNDPLTGVEARVLGSLIEKEMTTPDYYPMSINALMNACNQTSNRDPVVQYEEGTVASAVETMRRRSLVRAVQQSGSRVMKYRHLVAETMNLDARQAAVLCVLLLRGPQTVGELRTRGTRLTSLETLEEVETTLEELIARAPEPLVTRLPRRPGQKEVRYAHLLCGEVRVDDSDEAGEGTAVAAGRAQSADAERISGLEAGMEELRREVADLRSQLETFRKMFE